MSISSIRVAPGVDDGAARGEMDILLSLSSVPQSSPSEVMVDLQLACLLVVGQLTADLAVWTTGGVISTVVLHTTLQSGVNIIMTLFYIPFSVLASLRGGVGSRVCHGVTGRERLKDL